MKKIKAIKSTQTQRVNEFEPKRDENTTRGEASIWPKEYEEQRSMDIRMKPHPFPSSAKPVKKKKK